MKTRFIFLAVMLGMIASTVFTAATHAQLPYGYPRPYRYYGPYGYPPPIRCCYAPIFGIRIGGARSKKSSGINFQFAGVPEALLQEIAHSNLQIIGKKVNGIKGTAGSFSSKDGHILALPQGTYDVVIQLPRNPIMIKDVSVGKGEVITLPIPFYNQAGIVPQPPFVRPPYSGSRVNPIPNTKPLPQ